LKLLLYILEPVIGIHGFHRMRESRQLGALKASKSISWLQGRSLRLSILHFDHGLLHDLKHLSLHHQNLLQGRWRVSSIVLSVDVVVPCVNHLKDWGDKQEREQGREITVDKEIPN
jgi:hypothetical protein